jgi:hypothetical protein
MVFAIIHEVKNLCHGEMNCIDFHYLEMQWIPVEYFSPVEQLPQIHKVACKGLTLFTRIISTLSTLYTHIFSVRISN